MLAYNTSLHEALKHLQKVNLPTNLWYELQHSVGEEGPDGEADEVGQHFGEIRLLGEGDQEEAEQRRQVDHSDRQKPITPHWQGRNQGETVTNNIIVLHFLP